MNRSKEILQKIKEEPEAHFMLILPLRVKAPSSTESINSDTSKRSKTIRHSKSNLFQCDLCPIKFSDKVYIKRHMETHSAKNLKCDQCEFTTKTELYLKYHQKRHSGLKYECDFCGKRFHLKGILKSHQTFVHFGKRSFKCNQCDKSFKRKEILKIHISSSHCKFLNLFSVGLVGFNFYFLSIHLF